MFEMFELEQLCSPEGGQLANSGGSVVADEDRRDAENRLTRSRNMDVAQIVICHDLV